MTLSFLENYSQFHMLHMLSLQFFTKMHNLDMKAQYLKPPELPDCGVFDSDVVVFRCRSKF